MSYLWKTVRHGASGVDVHGFSEATTGVLSGQTVRQYLDTYPTLQEAVAAHPEALLADGTPRWGSRLTDPVVSLSHLPGEDDPVPGGMYPDDWE